MKHKFIINKEVFFKISNYTKTIEILDLLYFNSFDKTIKNDDSIIFKTNINKYISKEQDFKIKNIEYFSITNYRTFYNFKFFSDNYNRHAFIVDFNLREINDIEYSNIDNLPIIDIMSLYIKK